MLRVEAYRDWSPEVDRTSEWRRSLPSGSRFAPGAGHLLPPDSAIQGREPHSAGRAPTAASHSVCRDSCGCVPALTHTHSRFLPVRHGAQHELTSGWERVASGRKEWILMLLPCTQVHARRLRGTRNSKERLATPGRPQQSNRLPILSETRPQQSMNAGRSGQPDPSGMTRVDCRQDSNCRTQMPQLLRQKENNMQCGAVKA